jgi:hypothetical protein
VRLAHLDLTGVACATRVLARQRPSPSRTQLIGVQSRQCAAASDADVRAARQPLVYELIHRVLHTIIQRRSGFVEEDQRWLGGQNPAGRSAAAARLATASCPSQTPRPAGRPDARSCTCARCPRAALPAPQQGRLAAARRILDQQRRSAGLPRRGVQVRGLLARAVV